MYNISSININYLKLQNDMNVTTLFTMPVQAVASLTVPIMMETECMNTTWNVVGPSLQTKTKLYSCFSSNSNWRRMSGVDLTK